MIASIPRPSSLNARQWSILDTIDRYRIQPLDLLLAHYRDESRDAVRMQVERLIRRNWLTKTQFAGGVTYYALGTRSQRLFGLHHRPGWPFSQDGNLEHSAIGQFCALAGYERMRPEEFHARFPGIHRRGLPAQRYCLDLENQSKVAWVVVDHALDVRRFPGKIANVVAKRLALPGFDELVRQMRFQIVVLTATAQKRDRIREVLEQAPVCVPFDVLSFPSLLQFFIR